MDGAILLGFSVIVFLALAAGLALALVRSRLHRVHRVHPRRPTDAPLTWLADPRQAARLHRRLAKVGTATTRIIDDHEPRTGLRRRRVEPSPVADTARRVREEAVLVDHQVVRMATLASSSRRRPLADLHGAVTDLEGATARLLHLSVEVRSPLRLDHDVPGRLDAQAQVDRLAAAHRELDEIDARRGLAGDHLAAPAGARSVGTPTAVPAPPPPPARTRGGWQPG